MSGTVRVKVVCDECGRRACRSVDADGGCTFYRVPIGGGAGRDADTFSPQLVFCIDHGWADLDDPDLAAKFSGPSKRSACCMSVETSCTAHGSFPTAGTPQ